MRFPKPQTKAEIDALRSAFNRIRAEWHFARSLGPSKILQHWQKFVQELEEGYALTVYDYTLDLSMRDILEEIKEAVPSRLGREIEAALRPWDDRFRRATEPSTKPIDAGLDEDSKEWWFRIPRHAGPDLEGYLRAEGLL